MKPISQHQIVSKRGIFQLVDATACVAFYSRFCATGVSSLEVNNKKININDMKALGKRENTSNVIKRSSVSVPGRMRGREANTSILIFI